MELNEGAPQGTIYTFTMESKDSKLYPGIAREGGTFGTPDPNDPAKLTVTTSDPAPYARKVAVYVPKQYVPGTIAPFIVGADGCEAGQCRPIEVQSHYRVSARMWVDTESDHEAFPSNRECALVTHVCPSRYKAPWYPAITP